MSASPFPDLRVDEEQYPKYIVVRKIHPSNKVFSTYFKGAVPPRPARWPKVLKYQKRNYIPIHSFDAPDAHHEDALHIGTYLNEHGSTDGLAVEFEPGFCHAPRGVAMSLAIQGLGIANAREYDIAFKEWWNRRRPWSRKYLKVHIWYPFPGAETSKVFMRVANDDGTPFNRGQLAAAACSLFKEHFDSYVVRCGWATRPPPHTKPVTFDEFRLLGLSFSNDGSCRIAFGQVHRCTTGAVVPCIHDPDRPGELRLSYRMACAAQETAELAEHERIASVRRKHQKGWGRERGRHASYYI